MLMFELAVYWFWSEKCVYNDIFWLPRRVVASAIVGQSITGIISIYRQFLNIWKYAHMRLLT